MAFTTWNTGDVSANVTLSNGNLTATTTSASQGGVRSACGKRTGQVYVEFTCTTFSGSSTAVGLNGPTLALTSGWGLWSMAVNSAGTIYYNGNSTGLSIGTVTAGAKVCMAADLDNRRAWFRLNGGNWNGSASGDPTVPSSGTPFDVMAEYLCFGSNASGNAVTLNAGASAFAYTVPTGYAGWDTTDTSAPFLHGSVGRLITQKEATAPGSAGPGTNRNGSATNKTAGIRFYQQAGPCATISGNLTESGTPVAGRLVAVLRKRDHFLLGSALTDSSGNFSIQCGNTDQVYVVGFDPTTYQAIVYDQVIPL
ncbi:MAG: hypothetical protein PHY45_00990 [Rhodocyclaceae bacterium]|nr:hypothetical protein [Rhodocyclaceae bacterium]